MKRFIIGLLAGIGNILPGVSGAGLLIIFNLYEEIIDKICNLKNDFLNSIKYLLPIFIGIILGIYSFSNIINFLITKYYTSTYIVFIFFILGTIPFLFKKATQKGFKKRYLISFIISFIIGTLLLTLKTNYHVNSTIPNLLLTGSILSFSTIIPGISSTALLTIVGTYKIYLNAVSTLNINVLFFIILAFILTSLIIINILNYLLKKHYSYTYFAILGFTLSTIPGLIPRNIILNKDLLIGIILGILAFILSVIIAKGEK